MAMNLEDALADALGRSDWSIEFEREPTTEGYSVATATILRAGPVTLIVEVGSDDNDMFASMRAFVGEDPVDISTFEMDGSTLVTVNRTAVL